MYVTAAKCFISCFLYMTQMIFLYTVKHRDRSELVIGDDNLVLLTITAVNRGEGAYETELHTLIPPQADYIGVRRSAEVHESTLTVHTHRHVSEISFFDVQAQQHGY